VILIQEPALQIKSVPLFDCNNHIGILRPSPLAIALRWHCPLVRMGVIDPYNIPTLMTRSPLSHDHLFRGNPITTGSREVSLTRVYLTLVLVPGILHGADLVKFIVQLALNRVGFA
jgi:hypothetical protein